MKFEPKPLRHDLGLPSTESPLPSVMAFSMHKAGSTLLNNILERMARSLRITFFSTEDQLFKQNVSPARRPTDIGDLFQPTGYCFGGFRGFPLYPISILNSCRGVLLVRDPRDMIVSLYFSILKSHRLPGALMEGAEGAREEMLAARARLEQTSIDNFAVERLPGLIKEFEGYLVNGLHRRENIAIYRYEDVIFRKAEWSADMAEWFGWTLKPWVMPSILKDFDVKVEGERPDQHIRQVTPGNYKKYLSAGMIEHIEGMLGEYMRIFGYID